MSNSPELCRLFVQFKVQTGLTRVRGMAVDECLATCQSLAAISWPVQLTADTSPRTVCSTCAIDLHSVVSVRVEIAE